VSKAKLNGLCEAHGIATRYQDFWKQEHVPTAVAKRALLAAMGVAVGVRAKASQPGFDALVAPLVFRVGASTTPFIIAVPPLVSRGELHWQLALESGEHCAGTCTVARVAGAAGSNLNSTELQLECNGLPKVLPLGYHRLSITDATQSGTVVANVPVIVCPVRCAGIGAAPGTSRQFGPAIQLYALRSRRNWGIGDFTDLAALVWLAARHGAGFVGINPLHELFLDRPAQASPYSPSSRLALNPLYLDVEAVEEFAESNDAQAHVASPQFQARLAGLREMSLVDYAGVAAAKREVLALLYQRFRRDHLEPMDERGRAFRAFADAPDSGASGAALFDALQAALAGGDPAVWGWSTWPESYRDRESGAVHEFARVHHNEVDFYLYLQWQADRQLARAAKVAHEAGMPIGLYRDLAVGANPGGAETWHDLRRFAMAVHVGAPPDEFNQKGQDWGLPPWIPRRLPADGYEAWVALLRANMRHAGGLRIDHVMGLMRLFWIPEGMAPAEGTYVHYPLDDLLALLALESVRNGCVVVGEDLGTVPDAVRGALLDTRVHSYRVLYFERGAEGEFLPPDAYPAQALVTVSTHDLPTLHGFWQASDLATRDALDLFPSADLRARQYADRAMDRAHLAQALAHEGLPPLPAALGQLSFDDVLAVHAYVARTPCALMTIQLEDVFGELQQVNLPATLDDRYPNWRRKIPVNLEDWEHDGRYGDLCAVIRAEGRGATVGHGSALANP
jgi:(1->4)-alpha-D-glucan 1-alpha-D-glucosylmutase